MKQLTISKIAFGLIAFAAMAGVLAQSPQHQNHKPAPSASQHGGMMMHMDMSKHMADMKAADARLNTLTAKMNKATGTAKANATAAVVAELVAQQKSMRAMCMGMMSHMGSMNKGAKPAADHKKHGG